MASWWYIAVSASSLAAHLAIRPEMVAAMYPSDQIEALREVCGEVSGSMWTGMTDIYVPELDMPQGYTPTFRRAMLPQRLHPIVCGIHIQILPERSPHHHTPSNYRSYLIGGPKAHAHYAPCITNCRARAAACAIHCCPCCSMSKGLAPSGVACSSHTSPNVLSCSAPCPKCPDTTTHRL